VDMGISTYNNNQKRQFERSTHAHNTVILDNMNQSDVWSSFRIGKRASCIIVCDKEDELIAEHDGYRTLGYVHQRKFSIVENGFLIQDLLSGNFESTKFLLHFNYNIQPFLKENILSFKNGSVEFKNGFNEKQLLKYSQPVGFNKTKSAYKFVASISKYSSFLLRVDSL
jgi:hypothetical protein